MPTITPISELRNYGGVLERVAPGSPVYLTRNGHGAYSIRDIGDEENFQKAEGEEWISEEDFRDHFRKRRNERA